MLTANPKERPLLHREKFSETSPYRSEFRILGGANIIRQYLKAGLLDEMQIHLTPILRGEGIGHFKDFDAEGIQLRRADSIGTPSANPLALRGGKAAQYIGIGSKYSTFCDRE